MNFIALKMLVGNRAKYVGIIVGLTFASLLITQQSAIFLAHRYGTSRHLGNGFKSAVHRRPQTAERDGIASRPKRAGSSMGSPPIQRITEGPPFERDIPIMQRRRA